MIGAGAAIVSGEGSRASTRPCSLSSTIMPGVREAVATYTAPMPSRRVPARTAPSNTALRSPDCSSTETVRPGAICPSVVPV